MQFEGENLTLHTSRTEIDTLVSRLAQQIESTYGNTLSSEEPLHLIITLKGAVLFGVDLGRKLNVPTRIDFVRACSYGSGTKSSGNVQILKDVETDLTGKHVLLLDEIVDTGYTVDFLLSMFAKKMPASLNVCTLLNKPSRREVPVSLAFVGKDIEDQFLVGYGLDYGERFRNLPDIYYIQ